MSHASILVALDHGDRLPVGSWSAKNGALETAIAEQMRPFDENGSWFDDATRWDWWQVGGRYAGRWGGQDAILRRDINLDTVGRWQRERYTNGYRKAQEERAKVGPEHFEFFTGVKLDETLEQYLERVKEQLGFPAHYAFLRNHVWQEHERMGWFGVPARTECQANGKDVHICTFEQDDVRIVSWGGSDSWEKMFWPRFVEPLPADTLLVTVDYHV